MIHCAICWKTVPSAPPATACMVAREHGFIHLGGDAWLCDSTEELHTLARGSFQKEIKEAAEEDAADAARDNRVLRERTERA